MIPYSDLVGLVSSVDFNAYDARLFAILGQISTEEHEHRRPLLSVLVVHKTGDMQPGEGFFELAASLGRDTRDILKAWIAEVQKVYQYWN
jgi:molybdopterin synthase catalytic subunit